MRRNDIKNNEIGSIGIGAMIVFIALILVAAVASAVIISTGEKLQQNAQQTGSDTQREIAGKITVKSVLIQDATQAFMYFESSAGSEVLDVRDITWQIACSNPDPNADGVAVSTDNPGYQFNAGVFGDGIGGDAGTGEGANDAPAANNDDDPNHAYSEDVMGPTDDDGDGDFGDTNNDGVGNVAFTGSVPTAVTETDVNNEALLILPGENYVILMNFAGGITGNDCGINDLDINDQLTLWIHVEGGGSTYESLTITDKTFGSELV
jgi:archaellin